jgi:hypothetical protein
VWWHKKVSTKDMFKLLFKKLSFRPQKVGRVDMIGLGLSKMHLFAFKN